MFVAEGAKLVAEAAHYGKLQKIYIAESSQGREEERIQPLLEKFPYEVVSEEVFAEITDTVTPQGVLGLVQTSDSRGAYCDYQRIHRSRRFRLYLGTQNKNTLKQPRKN